MAAQTLLGTILLLAAVVVAVVSLRLYSRGGAVRDGVINLLDLLWVALGVAGAVLVSAVTGPVIYTAALTGGMVILAESVRVSRRLLGDVLYRSRRGVLGWLMISGGVVMLMYVADHLIVGWFETVPLSIRDHLLPPVLGIYLLGFGLSRFEIRAGGITPPLDSPIKWHEIESYDWTGGAGRRLTIRRQGLLGVGRVRQTIHADDRDRVDALLAERIRTPSEEVPGAGAEAHPGGGGEA